MDLDFERELHYHDDGYDSDNDYCLAAPFMRPVCIYLLSSTKGSFNPTDYRETEGFTFPTIPRQTKEELSLH